MKQDCWPWILTFSFLPRYRACAWHDDRYQYATIRNRLTRAKIDRIFLAQMLVEKPNNIKTAHIYYYLVRIFGWIIFYKPLINELYKTMKDNYNNN